MTLNPTTFVGGGYRTTSFLARHIDVVQGGVLVVERSEHVGPGAFSKYDCVSTSVASRFFSGIEPAVIDASGEPRLLQSLSNQSRQSVHLNTVAEGMQALARGLRAFDSYTEWTGTVVTKVEARPNFAAIEAVDRPTLTASHAVLATGRHEHLLQELRPWRNKTMLASLAMSWASQDRLRVALLEPASSFVVVGSSHSAAAVLLRLRRLAIQLGVTPPRTTVLTRSGIRLHYPSVEDAVKERNTLWEVPLDSLLDVCPDTLQVNRDSGLRGDGRTLMVETMESAAEPFSLQRISEVTDARELLDSASLVVQAAGFVGQAPAIVVHDGRVRRSDSKEPLLNLPDGTAMINGQPIRRLSALRVEPTPRALRDHAAYGQSTYKRLAVRLLNDQARMQ